MFDLVTSHNVLAHVYDLKKIFSNIHDVLIDDGYFCFEVGYFYEVLKNNYFDTIYHEHLDYHHSYPLVYFLNNIGFSLINISTNSIQGGTIRILCRKTRIISNTNQVMNFVKKEKNTVPFYCCVFFIKQLFLFIVACFLSNNGSFFSCR